MSSYYDNKADSTEEDLSVVVIPLPHLGTHGYGNVTDHLFSRVFHMALSVAWLAMNEALTLNVGNKSKNALCKTIIDNVLAKVGHNTPFGKKLRAAVEAHGEAFRSKRKDWRAPGTSAAGKDVRSKGPEHDVLPLTTTASSGKTIIAQRSLEVARRREQSWFDAHRLDHRKPANSSMSVSVVDDDYVLNDDEHRWRLAFEELHITIIYGLVSGDQ